MPSRVRRLTAGGRKRSANDRLTCPSSRAAPGARLLGVVQDDGRVAFLPTPLTIDVEFVTRAENAGSPERRFRFAGACVKGLCSQWTGTACGVIERVLERIAVDKLEPGDEAAPPACAIRADCRWYRQRAVAACRICPLIVTDQCGQ